MAVAIAAKRQGSLSTRMAVVPANVRVVSRCKLLIRESDVKCNNTAAHRKYMNEQDLKE